jgi:hypothetical protein
MKRTRKTADWIRHRYARGGFPPPGRGRGKSNLAVRDCGTLMGRNSSWRRKAWQKSGKIAMRIMGNYCMCLKASSAAPFLEVVACSLAASRRRAVFKGVLL